MLIDHNRDKLFALIFHFTKHTKYCNKTKLFKLLYHVDFWHCKQTGKPITNMTYETWEKGPVPRELWRELKFPSEDFKKAFATWKDEGSEKLNVKVRPNFKPKNEFFTPREVEIIRRVTEIYKNEKSDVMWKSTHLPNDPWDRARTDFGMKREIPYDYSLDSSPESLTREQYNERLADHLETRDALE